MLPPPTAAPPPNGFATPPATGGATGVVAAGAELPPTVEMPPPKGFDTLLVDGAIAATPTANDEGAVEEAAASPPDGFSTSELPVGFPGTGDMLASAGVLEAMPVDLSSESPAGKVEVEIAAEAPAEAPPNVNPAGADVFLSEAGVTSTVEEEATAAVDPPLGSGTGDLDLWSTAWSWKDLLLAIPPVKLLPWELLLPLLLGPENPGERDTLTGDGGGFPNIPPVPLPLLLRRTRGLPILSWDELRVDLLGEETGCGGGAGAAAATTEAIGGVGEEG